MYNNNNNDNSNNDIESISRHKCELCNNIELNFLNKPMQSILHTNDLWYYYQQCNLNECCKCHKYFHIDCMPNIGMNISERNKNQNKTNSVEWMCWFCMGKNIYILILEIKNNTLYY